MAFIVNCFIDYMLTINYLQFDLMFVTHDVSVGYIDDLMWGHVWTCFGKWHSLCMEEAFETNNTNT